MGGAAHAQFVCVLAGMAAPSPWHASRHMDCIGLTFASARTDSDGRPPPAPSPETAAEYYELVGAPRAPFVSCLVG